mmetsp:Transcript_23543/g.67298  ORF Transcript_23543/g.67298 Transcript_23543/m.67298 type:complete len:200 (+) Transcript_23543:605-1204(+)
MEPICMHTAELMKRLESTFQMEFSLPVTLVRKAPASVQGASVKMTGAVPSSIWATLSLKMPHVTLTGQSGPPTSTATLPMSNPFLSKILWIARTRTLSTPMSCCTFTDFPKKKPIMYCPKEAVSFRPHATAIATAVPPQKPRDSRLAPWAAMTTPQKTYTGTPGTGGSRNMAKPIATMIPTTMPNSYDARSVLSQDRNT